MTLLPVALEGGASVEVIRHPNPSDEGTQGTMPAPMALHASFPTRPGPCMAVRLAAGRHRAAEQVPSAAAALAAPAVAARPQVKSVRLGRGAPSFVPRRSGARRWIGRRPAGKAKEPLDR